MSSLLTVLHSALLRYVRAAGDPETGEENKKRVFPVRSDVFPNQQTYRLSMSKSLLVWAHEGMRRIIGNPHEIGGMSFSLCCNNRAVYNGTGG